MYCTTDELIDLMPENEIIQLVDDERLGLISPAGTLRITATIEDVSAEIDASFLKGGYTLPLSNTVLARSLSKQLTICRLIARKGVVPNEARKQLCIDANALLKAIAEGKVTLDQTGHGVGVKRDDRTEIFTKENLETF